MRTNHFTDTTDGVRISIYDDGAEYTGPVVTATPASPQPATEKAELDHCRELIAAAVEALTVPYPATVGDEDAYHRLLADRATSVRIALGGLTEPVVHPAVAEVNAAWLRSQITRTPATYATEGGAS